MLVLPNASFAKPARLLPVSNLNIKIGQNDDGSDTYVKRGSWAHHHISTAANIAFALLWAFEGRTALQIVAYRLVEAWQKRNQSTQNQGKKLPLRPGAPLDLTGIRNCIDYFLRKCHQNFPVVELGHPTDGEMAHARLEPSGQVVGTFVPEPWAVIVLNKREIDSALCNAQIDPTETEQKDTNKLIYYLAVAIARAMCNLIVPDLDGNAGNVTCEEVVNNMAAPSSRPADAEAKALALAAAGTSNLGHAWELELFGGHHVANLSPSYSGLMVFLPPVLALQTKNEQEIPLSEEDVRSFTCIPPDFSQARKHKFRPMPLNGQLGPEPPAK